MTPKPQQANQNAPSVTLEAITASIRTFLDAAPADERAAAVAEIRATLAEHSPRRHHPVDHVTWLPLEQISPNDYNPNAVAAPELALLRRSIEADGLTQPIVVAPDEDAPGRYRIVDGYHRWHTLSTNPYLAESAGHHAPAVILATSPNGRMAATIRHNRARGKHRLDGMAAIIYAMLERGWTDPDICRELGMHPEELTRLKHVTGFSRLFAEREYSRAWLTKNQIKARAAYRQAQQGEEDQTS